MLQMNCEHAKNAVELEAGVPASMLLCCAAELQLLLCAVNTPHAVSSADLFCSTVAAG
jgi:hypothetical protein